MVGGVSRTVGVHKYFLRFDLLEALHRMPKTTCELSESTLRLAFQYEARDIPNEFENGSVLTWIRE